MEDAVTHQALKSQRTRERLLDATLEVIVSDGFARATTARICEVAGVSRGAQTHHYPTKNELIVAALQRMTLQWVVEARDLMASLDPSDRLLRTVIDSLWEGFLDDHFISCVLDVLVAARTDQILRPVVAEADRAVVEAVVAFSVDIAHPTASPEQLAEALEMTFYYFRGLALERGIHDDDKFRTTLVDTWSDAIERALSPAQFPPQRWPG